MFYKKNVDFVELLWEDFTFQIENKDHKKQEKICYPRFTKEIIHYFITKGKSISMRNIMFMHTAQDDNILGTMIFVSKYEDFQVYGALLTSRMTNQQMHEFDAYKTYLAYATGEASPKMKRKLKKPASPSKKRTLVTGIELLSDAALLEECQLIKALTRSKRETTIHQAGGSSEEVDFESEVPDEPKGKSIDTSKGTSLKPRVPDVSKDDEEVQESDDEPQHADDEGTDFENQETNDDEEETEDEFVHTPPNYVPTDDETNDESNDVTEEEYERINEELYGDVNVRLTNAEPDDEHKGHKEMTNAETEDAEHENVNQEGAGNQVKDDAQVIQKNVVDIIKEHSVPAKTVESLRQQYAPQKKFDQRTTLFETMTKSKLFNKIPKQRALYHALMESILEDEDAIDEGVADKLKTRKPNNADKDKGHSAGSDRELKRWKTNKDTEPSKKAKSTDSSKGTSKSQPKSIGKSAQAEETVFEAGDTQEPQNQGQDMGNTDDQPNVEAALKHYWFKKPERPPTPDSD
ncbi:hypothetical protein Tco_1401152 [Tanacetum coccineum]